MNHLEDCTAQVVASHCVHCGLECDKNFIWKNQSFCCRGCLRVYQVLNQQGLLEYYSLRDGSYGPLPNRVAPNELWKSEAFANTYVSHQLQLDLFIEGIHCTACLWLLEKLPEIVGSVETARLNLGTQILHLKLKSKSRLEDIQNQISSWGYQAHPLPPGCDATDLQQIEYRSDLYRLGVAAAGAGNVMLLTVCIYAGLQGALAELFQWLSFALTLPVLFYSGFPLIKSTQVSFKQKELSIDLPILVAIFTAFSVSVFSLFKSQGPTYFDSITTLIFLILATRFYFKRTHALQWAKTKRDFFSGLEFGRRLTSAGEEIIPPEKIQLGDELLVKSGEIIPVDSKILSGAGWIDQSLMTGESSPIQALHNAFVFTGSKLFFGQIKIQAINNHSNSRIPKMLRELEISAPKLSASKVSERVAHWFLLGVFITLSIFLGTQLILGQMPLEEILRRSLAFIIVVCPCTFASVIPMIYVLALRRAGQMGVFVKDSFVFEKLPSIQKIYFDKTGTLTEGQFKILHWQKNLTHQQNSQLFSLSLASPHPVSRAIAQYLSERGEVLEILPVTEFHEISARGIFAKFGADTITIEKLPVDNATHPPVSANKFVQVAINGAPVIEIEMGDKLRPESALVISQLKKRGYNIEILSGDSQSVVDGVAGQLGISSARGDLSLDEKSQLIFQESKSGSGTMMVGDGNNDALAMRSSSMGVATRGGVETALRSSDIYLSKNLATLISFIDLTKLTHTLTWQVLTLAVIYNLAAGVLALSGIIHPLIAALIMPLNAITAMGYAMIRMNSKGPSWM